MAAPNPTHLRPEAVHGRRQPEARAWARWVPDPDWARWRGASARHYSLGAEEEVMLVDPRDGALRQCSDHVIARLSRKLSPHVSPETHAGVLELATGVHLDVDGILSQLGWLRRQLRHELGRMGVTAATAGTHPWTIWSETTISGDLRYRRLHESMRALARREPTMALHVHVGVPTPEDAVRLLNGLRRAVPVLLALSGNSPFWQGRDAGFASARTVIFQAFPRTGLPRSFESYAEYVHTVDALIASGAVPDPTSLWWDVRLQPALGTVEVRVMDAQSTLDDVAPIVALVQSLARHELEGDASEPVPGPEILAENRFLAARDGMDARLIDAEARQLIPVRDMLDELVGACRPHALALGCAGELDQVHRLASDTGADRQRALATGSAPLRRVVRGLAGRFLALPSLDLALSRKRGQV